MCTNLLGISIWGLILSCSFVGWPDSCFVGGSWDAAVNSLVIVHLLLQGVLLLLLRLQFILVLFNLTLPIVLKGHPANQKCVAVVEFILLDRQKQLFFNLWETSGDALSIFLLLSQDFVITES